MLNRRLCRDGHELQNCLHNEVLNAPGSYAPAREYPVLVVWHEEYELEYGRMVAYDYVYSSEFPWIVPTG